MTALLIPLAFLVLHRFYAQEYRFPTDASHKRIISPRQTTLGSLFSWGAAEFNESWWKCWNENSTWDALRQFRAFVVTMAGRKKKKKKKAPEGCFLNDPSNMWEDQQGAPASPRGPRGANIEITSYLYQWDLLCCVRSFQISEVRVSVGALTSGEWSVFELLSRARCQR